jgi:hypothetical protein
MFMFPVVKYPMYQWFILIFKLQLWKLRKLHRLPFCMAIIWFIFPKHMKESSESHGTIVHMGLSENSVPLNPKVPHHVQAPEKKWKTYHLPSPNRKGDEASTPRLPAANTLMKFSSGVWISQKWMVKSPMKIGYIPNYSHLIGIMIINHWV